MKSIPECVAEAKAAGVTYGAWVKTQGEQEKANPPRVCALCGEPIRRRHKNARYCISCSDRAMGIARRKYTAKKARLSALTP